MAGVPYAGKWEEGENNKTENKYQGALILQSVNKVLLMKNTKEQRWKQEKKTRAEASLAEHPAH